MPKATLTFPDPDSLWLFKDKSRAINIAVVPRKNRITGLFSSEEIDIAVKEFKGVQIMNAATKPQPSVLKFTSTTTTRLFSRVKFYNLLSLIKL
jgi:hypothetical protein